MDVRVAGGVAAAGGENDRDGVSPERRLHETEQVTAARISMAERLYSLGCVRSNAAGEPPYTGPSAATWPGGSGGPVARAGATFPGPARSAHRALARAPEERFPRSQRSSKRWFSRWPAGKVRPPRFTLAGANEMPGGWRTVWLCVLACSSVLPWGAAREYGSDGRRGNRVAGFPFENWE